MEIDSTPLWDFEETDTDEEDTPWVLQEVQREIYGVDYERYANTTLRADLDKAMEMSLDMGHWEDVFEEMCNEEEEVDLPTAIRIFAVKTRLGVAF